MTDIDTILLTEKQQQHRLDDPDLLVFATLTQIAHEDARARLKNRFRLGIVLCVLLSLAALQAFSLSNLSFTQLSQQLSELITRYPYALTIVNGALAAAVLVARRLRFI